MTLKIVSPEEVEALCIDPVDPVAREQAALILSTVKLQGLNGLIETAVRLKDIESEDAKLFYNTEELKPFYDALDEVSKEVLQRTANRIKSFAQEQRKAIKPMTTTIDGGKAGHYVAAIEVAGCYAPGGRYPLPSSVLMTAVTARSAGVKTVIVSSPRPAAATFAAAYVAGADGLLVVGGAQAIAAMAYGVGPVPRCDVIVGPGNKWVTAAKSLVSGICAIDMLAGPSEVLVVADESCDPNVVAADLLAQAEHDVEARPILVCTDHSIVEKVNAC
jgi:phosphoribosyl-ATP pyrophosphohydrolase/phosphoribosyl-AMP cyclohydrolase/histidinol dehydrogenase